MHSSFPRMPLPAELTYEFFGTFARCEYALKVAGFARGGGSSVAADWDAFGTSIDWHFQRLSDQEFKEAVAYLLTEPPRKQVLRNGRVEWKESPPDPNLPKSQQTLLMVRRVRNNLFHGAKVWSPEYRNRERDVKLVNSALLVLKHCVEINAEVSVGYEIGIF